MEEENVGLNAALDELLRAKTTEQRAGLSGSIQRQNWCLVSG